MTTIQRSRGEVLTAEITFVTLSGFSFKNPRMKHGIRENLAVLTPMARRIKASLYEIRNEHIELDSNGKRKKDLNTEKWMWKPDGEALSLQEQTDFLSDMVEIPFYTIKENWMEPCWRYVKDNKEKAVEGAMVREEYFLTVSDTQHIAYAVKYNEYTEEDECLDLDSD